MFDLTDVARFLTKIKPSSSGCLEWNAGKDSDGYGIFYIISTKSSVRAHRFAWRIAHNKDIPNGLWILHHCDNPSCVNPDHLYAGTGVDNMRDCQSRGRHINGGALYWASRTRCHKGHPFAGSNLIVRKNSNGARERFCRICRREATKRSMAKIRRNKTCLI